MTDPWNVPPADRLDLDDPDYRLAWPRDLFTDELTVVHGLHETEASAGLLLLEEAFVGSSAADEYRTGAGSARALIDELSRRAPELREQSRTAPRYYMHRAQGPAPVAEPDMEGAQRRFRTTVASLDAHGYFDRAWGANCVDDARSWRTPVDDIEDELGLPGVDPFDRSAPLWDEDVFLSVAEVLHDRVARPRVITRFHDFADCGRHYGAYALAPGQAVYRHQVNRIFRQSRIPFRLSDAAEDYGRVVAFTDDASEDLARDALITAEPQERDEVSHAITMFRARGADRDAKRSAILTLARILEQHRPLLKTELMSADESALFQIANRFDIRHRNDKQLADYDAAFLDWIFWTYLASVRLLRHLRTRTATRP